MSRRPKVGVTGPDRGGLGAWLATRYALARAGARAVRLTPRRTPMPTDLDGLVIGGGADVGWQQWELPPARPEERGRRVLDVLLFPLIALLRLLAGKHQRAGENAARDRLEFECLGIAQARGLPVLGICRGAQLINVYLGGRLYRDLSSFYEEGQAVSSVLPRKRVLIEPDSRLGRLLGLTRCRVNALHRQAIDDSHLGKGLAVVAREASGLVQAVETVDEWPVIGVQWHPEYMPQRPEQARLFTGMVDLARARSAAARM